MLTLAFLVAAFAAAQVDSLEALVEDARLVVGEKELAPVWSDDEWRQTRPVGQHRLRVYGDRIEAEAPDGSMVWSAPFPAVGKLHWLTDFGDLALLRDTSGVNDNLHCVDVSKGAWLEPFDVDPNGARLRIEAAAVREGELFLYAASYRPGPAFGPSVVEKDYVLRVDPRTRVVAWKRELEHRGGGPLRAWLIAARRPHFDAARTAALQPTSDGILLCTGGRNDAVLLDAENGAIRAVARRPWELQRTFVGPSVWQHAITRFGASHPPRSSTALETYELLEKEKPERERFEASWRGEVLGGPAVVPLFHRGRPCGNAVLLAMVRERADSPYPGYLAEHYVLELDGGTPISMLAMPRALMPRSWTQDGDAVVWACTGGGFARIRATTLDERLAVGPGGADAIGHLSWYRELAAPEIQAWLSTDAAADVVAFGAGHAYRPAGGGFVLDQGQPVFEFPIWQVALDDGDARLLTLKVPIRGTLEHPTENYQGNDDHMHAFGPYGLGLTWMEVVDQQLFLQVTTEHTLWGVEFDLAQADGR